MGRVLTRLILRSGPHYKYSTIRDSGCLEREDCEGSGLSNWALGSGPLVPYPCLARQTACKTTNRLPNNWTVAPIIVAYAAPRSPQPGTRTRHASAVVIVTTR